MKIRHPNIELSVADKLSKFLDDESEDNNGYIYIHTLTGSQLVAFKNMLSGSELAALTNNNYIFDSYPMSSIIDEMRYELSKLIIEDIALA